MTDDNSIKTYRSTSFFLWTSVSIIVVVLDQLTKWMIVKWVPLYDKIPVNGFINIKVRRKHVQLI